MKTTNTSKPPHSEPKKRPAKNQCPALSSPRGKVYGHCMDSDMITFSAARRKFSKVRHICATNDDGSGRVNLFEVPLCEVSNSGPSPMESQVKAKSWKGKEQLEERAVNLEKKLKIHENNHLEVTMANMALELKALRTRVEKLERKTDSLEEENRGLKTKVASLEEENRGLKEENRGLKTKVASLEDENTELNDKIQSLEEKNAAFSTILGEQKERLESFEERMLSL